MFSPVSFVKNPVMWLELVSLKRATHLQAPNFAYRLTCRKFLLATGKKQLKLDLTSVKHCFNAAEPIDSEAMQEFCEMFSKFGFAREAMVPGYGLAEHTVYVCDGGMQQLVVDREALESTGKVIATPNNGVCMVGLGSPPPSAQVKILIVDAQTKEKLAGGCVGEIWVTSRSKSSEYFGLQEQSQRDLHAKLQQQGGLRSNRESTSGSQSSLPQHREDLPREPATEEELALEWLRTGDLGFVYQGELFVCGRIKDLIIVRGRNHFPQDLERTAEAAGLNKIRPGCVGAFASEDDAVVIVAELRSAATMAELNQLCDSIRIAIAKEHGVAVIAICLIKERTIPKTTSGKLSRHRIRAAYLESALQVLHEWKSASVGEEEEEVQPFANLAPSTGKLVDMSPEEVLLQLKREVVSLLELQVADAAEVDANVAMQELGFDSMMLTQLKGSIINVFQVEVEDEVLYDEHCTLQKVADMVVKMRAGGEEEQEQKDEVASKRGSVASGKRKPWIAGFKKGQKCGFCGC